MERQLTFRPHGHILTNTGVWSPDGRWIVYDVRSDPAGSVFDGTRIERVHADSGQVEVLYESRNGACCGVVSYSPVDERLVFILGPENPTSDWSYGIARRQGVILDAGKIVNLDARDLVSPFTPGALQGGSHLHTFSPSGCYVAFTYDDLLHPEWNRNVGICEPGEVIVPSKHPRNHSGSFTARLLTRTANRPGRAGCVNAPIDTSVSYYRASEEGWLDDDTLAFQGEQADGRRELYLVTRQGEERRLTYSAGLAGPRHWPRVGPDGRIAVLMKDAAGIVQVFTVTRNGETVQLTQEPCDVESAFSWVGRSIAHVRQGRVCIADSHSGRVRYLTQKGSIRPEACVLSPDGSRVAFVRSVDGFNQVFCVSTVC